MVGSGGVVCADMLSGVGEAMSAEVEGPFGGGVGVGVLQSQHGMQLYTHARRSSLLGGGSGLRLGLTDGESDRFRVGVSRLLLLLL